MSRLVRACASVLLCMSSGLLLAQTLKITEPKEGAVVSSGQTLDVVVEARPERAFQVVIIIGWDPIGFSDGHPVPPSHFPLEIPANTQPGRYCITADGTLEPGKGVSSEPVGIQVEHSGTPLSLKAEPSILYIQGVGDERRVAAVGEFSDAKRIYLDKSIYVRYDTDNPNVATVSPDGRVSATGPGSTKITIRYNDQSTVIPVIVRKPQASQR
jgi:hypothetical protein